MISVIVLWCYIILTAYPIGFFVIRLIAGSKKTDYIRKDGYLMAGLVIVTVYAQFFSLFYKVGLLANILLIVICIAICINYHKQLSEHIKTLRFTLNPVRAAVCVFLALLFAYGTSRGIIHYDTSLYHAQSIRWIEEFGCVPGLGNLHSRLAYNSASFCLSALYSMSFLGGQSFHVMAGFFGFILACVSTSCLTKNREHKPLLSDLARVFAVYYLLIIFDEMVSPASDYFMVLLIFYVVIKWLDLVEHRIKDYFPYALLCILGVYILSVKLSGAVILLLTIKPAVMLIRERKGKEIAKFLGLGIFTALPYLIRNVILSGWLVYPFTGIDLFSVDFKIPKGMADYDAREIQVWGRGYSDVAQFDKPITTWLSEWFRAQGTLDQIFVLAAVTAIALLLCQIVWGLIRKKKEDGDILLLLVTIAVSFLFWLTSAPLIRYGCVFLWLTPVLILGNIYLKHTRNYDRFRLLYIALLLLGCYKAFMFGRELKIAFTPHYFLLQKDYENYPVVAYELHGYTFYYPESGDQTGYDAFPSAPARAEDIFRTNDIRDGFKDVIHS